MEALAYDDSILVSPIQDSEAFRLQASIFSNFVFNSFIIVSVLWENLI